MLTGELPPHPDADGTQATLTYTITHCRGPPKNKPKKKGTYYHEGGMQRIIGVGICILSANREKSSPLYTNSSYGDAAAIMMD
jgi:hypothetical protein